jgi:hypothetical protein
MPPVNKPDRCQLEELKYPIDSTVTNLRNKNVHSIGPTNATLNSENKIQRKCLIVKNNCCRFAAKWDADEWAYVCDQLGVSIKEAADEERVPIKFCHYVWGCNFALCPHRDEDDLITLFQCPSKKPLPIEISNQAASEKPQLASFAAIWIAVLIVT